MQTEVLPSELHLVVPPTLPQARSYMFKQQSELQEYDVQKGNRIRINIPRLQRSYLMKDSYLRFRLNVDISSTATNQKLYFDRCGAYGLFDRIEVYDYLGGTLLEQTQNIPALITTIGDLTYKMTDFNGGLSSTQGYDGSNVQNAPTSFNQYEIRTANTGQVLCTTSGTETSFITYEFAMPIPSFLDMFSEKYIPLHNGFSIDFFLNSTDLAFVNRIGETDPSTSLTIDSCWISNFEYCCQVMELGEQAESMVVAQEPMVMHSNQFRYFSDIVLGAGTQSTFRMDMNLNVVSLRNIRFGMRPTVYQTLAYPSYGHRVRNFLNNFNFQYGSSYLPEIAGIDCRKLSVPSSRKGYALKMGSTAPSNAQADWPKAAGFSQSYMEVTKTTSPTNTMGSTINWLEYMIDLGASNNGAVTNCDFATPLTGTTAKIPAPGQTNSGICGKFVGGIDTRLSKKNTVSGIDTNGLLVSLNGSFDRDNVNNMTQSILDVWAEYDSFIQVIPGVATTATF
jgi:hypothetical protein